MPHGVFFIHFIGSYIMSISRVQRILEIVEPLEIHFELEIVCCIQIPCIKHSHQKWRGYMLVVIFIGWEGGDMFKS